MNAKFAQLAKENIHTKTKTHFRFRYLQNRCWDAKQEKNYREQENYQIFMIF